MNRFAKPLFIFATAFIAGGCATSSLPLRTVFKSRPTYPITEIQISSSLRLRHIAGAPCDYNSNARPIIGSESTRTYSVYKLIDKEGNQIFEAPSMLSDPEKGAGEFRAYYIANDRLTVLTSKSEDTILIIEDRSPAGPNEAHILLRHGVDGKWTWSQIHVSTVKPPGERIVAPPDMFFPEVQGLTDTRIWFNDGHRTWSQTIE